MRTLQEYQYIIIKEAESWIGTPYKWGCKEKSKGVDCAEFCARPFKKASLIHHGVVVPREGRHAVCGENTDPDKFKEYLHKFCIEVKYQDRELCDIISFAVNGMERHVAILVEKDPDYIIHAVSGSRVRKQRLKKIKSLDTVYRFKTLAELYKHGE